MLVHLLYIRKYHTMECNLWWGALEKIYILCEMLHGQPDIKMPTRLLVESNKLQELLKAILHTNCSFFFFSWMPSITVNKGELLALNIRSPYAKNPSCRMDIIDVFTTQETSKPLAVKNNLVIYNRHSLMREKAIKIVILPRATVTQHMRLKFQTHCHKTTD